MPKGNVQHFKRLLIGGIKQMWHVLEVGIISAKMLSMIWS